MKKVFNKIKQAINDMKIKQKIIAIYIIGGLLPQLFLIAYLMNGTKNILVEQTKNSEISELNTISNRLLETMRIVSDVSLRMYFDEELERIAKTNYTNYIDLIKDYSDYRTITNYLDYYNREIEGIRIYIVNDSLSTNSRFFKVNDKIEAEQWYQESLNGNGRAVWNYIYDSITRKHYVCLTRLIRTKLNEEVGVLMIAVKNDVLDALISQRNFETAIIVNDEQIAATNRTESEKNELIQLLKDYRSNNAQRVMYKGEECLLTVKDISYSKTKSYATVISLQPYSLIVQGANEKAMEGYFFVIISIILSAGLIVFFSYRFSERVKLFHRQMHKAARGNFNIAVKLDGKDEIAELYNDLYAMIESIQKLLNDIYNEKIQKEKLYSKQKDVEFKMLASQINPHFLYNTLETIRMKARCNKQYEIEELVKMLAKIMRRNIEVGDNLVSLKSEIELVESYLKIQQYRFGDKISFQIQILCEINKFQILPLMIQPIVENAFVHGLESKEGQGEIKITIYEDVYLKIEVKDNGVGIKEEDLSRLNDSLDTDVIRDKSSIGLSNVNQRIKLLYGVEYGISITSKLHEGTKVIIALPKGIGL